jgi:hypothetical protein
MNLEPQGARHHRIHRQPGCGERGFDRLDGVFIADGLAPKRPV